MDKHESAFNFFCESKDQAIWFGQARHKNHFIFNTVKYSAEIHPLTLCTMGPIWSEAVMKSTNI